MNSPRYPVLRVLLVFGAIHVLSAAADVLSTLYCTWRTGDWGLANESNFLLAGTSVPALILHASVAVLFFVGMFVLAWSNRAILYPGEPCSLGQFYRFAPFGKRVSWAQSFYKSPRLKNFLVIMGVCFPVALTLVHLRAAATNTMQAIGILYWTPWGVAHVLVRIAEVCIGLAAGFCLIFLDYRAYVRQVRA